MHNMSQEQARIDADRLGAQDGVYSLGLILKILVSMRIILPVLVRQSLLKDSPVLL